MKAEVYYNGLLAGMLEKAAGNYSFSYDENYLKDDSLPAVSFSFPKQSAAFYSTILFPFFFGLLAEGDNKAVQCRTLRIDENDHFQRLLKTAGSDTIGAITVREIKDNE